MKLTNKLRWVIREKREPWPDPWNPHIDNCGEVITERVTQWQVLQQKWEAVPNPDYCSLKPNATEWRDVPEGVE